MGGWWETSDKIEMPTVAGGNIPQAMSMQFAWPETIQDHWNRIYAIKQEADANKWRYRSYLPYRMKYLSMYRKAFDGLDCPMWAKLTREELRVTLCVDDNRLPIPFQEAIKPLAEKAAEGLQYRDARRKLQKQIHNERLMHHDETVTAVKWFRKNMMEKLVYWEWCNPQGWVWHNHFEDNRPLYVAKVSQNVQGRDKNYLTLLFVDSALRQHAFTAVDFHAWIEDEILYVTELPYYGVNGRKMRRQRFRKCA